MPLGLPSCYALALPGARDPAVGSQSERVGVAVGDEKPLWESAGEPEELSGDELRWMVEPPLYWIVRHQGASLPAIRGLSYLATNRFADSPFDETLVATPEQSNLIELLREVPGVCSVEPGYLRYFFRPPMVIAVLNRSAINWFDSIDEALSWDPFGDPDIALSPHA